MSSSSSSSSSSGPAVGKDQSRLQASSSSSDERISPASVITTNAMHTSSHGSGTAASGMVATSATATATSVRPQESQQVFVSSDSTSSSGGDSINITQILMQQYEEYNEEEAEEEAEEDDHVLLGSGEYNLVGIRYYKGVAHPGEFVMLNREPHNPYDRNAIRVDNLQGEKVGHIKRESAARLAPLMDHQRDLMLEASIPRKGNTFQLPLKIDFYCVVARNADTIAAAVSHETSVSSILSSNYEEDARREQQVRGLFNTLKSSLRYDSKFRPAPAFGGPQPESHAKPAQQIKKVDWDVQSKELDEMFDKQTEQQLKELPNMSMPIQFKDKVSLYQHQIDGIKWLVHQENKMNESNGKGNNPFFKEVHEGKRKRWLCDITKSSQASPPSDFSGSILADEMGLGKTLQTIGLILLAPPKDHVYHKGTEESELQNPASKGSKLGDEEEEKDNILIPSEEMVRCQKATILKSILKAAGMKQSGKKTDQIDRILAGVKNGMISESHFPSFMTAASSTGTTGICSLIVCPVSVMSNWDVQIRSFVKHGVLNVKAYCGQDRQELLPLLQGGKIDVLIVSYQTLSSEFKNCFPESDAANTDGPPPKKLKQLSLFDMNFHRIILDEAHQIRNDNTRYFKAVKKIKAGRKLALTGTPFVNKADDMFSLFSFIGIEPLNDKALFRRSITQPLKNGDDIGLSRLRAAMSYIALRRGKSKVGIKLADKEVQIRSIQFPPNDRNEEVYQAFYGTLKLALEAVLQDDDEISVLKNYSSILEKILRLRQTCCSARLVNDGRRKFALKMWQELQESKSAKRLTKEEGLKLLAKLQGTFEDDDVPECPVCMMEMEEQDSRVLLCGHVYCYLCLSKLLERSDKASCPICRASFNKIDVIDKKNASTAASQTPIDKESVISENIGTSPKVLALLDAINLMQPDEKGVVFSQFTKFLDIIGDALKEVGIKFTRIDGSKSAQKRLEAVNAFSSDDERSPRFILCSLRAAGTGINLTRGNYAFMMDCWWNESIENQAMDRIHRIGQKRKVTIIRYVMKDTIEERIIALQQAKSLQAKGAMEKLNTEEKKKARLDQLKGLLLLSKVDNK